MRFRRGEIMAVCEWCGAELNKGKRFCSRKCYGEAMKQGPFIFTCEWCGGKFERKQREHHPGRPFRFCSRECFHAAFRGERHPRYHGGCAHGAGYWRVKVDGRDVLEHRKIFAEALGRDLLPGEVIHHIDGDRMNNDLGNLWLFPSHADHARYHATGESRGLTVSEVTGG